MITHTPTNAFLIRLSIILLRYAPLFEIFLLSLLLATYFSQPGDPPNLTATALLPVLITLTALLFSVEIIYYLTLYRPHEQRLSKTLAEHPIPSLSPVERSALFEKCAANVPDWEHYLSLWFLGTTSPEKLARSTVREFILWAFFERPSTDSEEEERELDGYIARIETLSGYVFPEEAAAAESQPDVKAAAKSLRLTFDPVEIRYKSILWYGIVALVDGITHFHLWRAGFVHHRPSPARPTPSVVAAVAKKSHGNTPLNSIFHSFPPRIAHRHHAKTKSLAGDVGYYFRPHRSSSSRLPVVFIHGIGIGLWPYRQFLSELNDEQDEEQIGILALEILPLSARLTSPLLSQARFLEQFREILSQHGQDWKEFVLVTHSYGSVMATHILHSAELSPRVRGLVMVDPVTVLLHLPDVAYNFTRRSPRRANELQLWYFASMEVGVAEGLGRHFFWRENIIWREELQQVGTCGHSQVRESGDDADGEGQAAVFLSGRDLIVDTHTVAHYLASEGDFGSESANSGLFNILEHVPGTNRNYMAPSGIEIVWFPDLDHAQIFEQREDRRRVIEVVKRYCRGSAV